MSTHYDAFGNRLKKNAKALRKWRTREKIEAYRLYDKDIPEFPYIVEVYGAHVVITEQSNVSVADSEAQRAHEQCICATVATCIADATIHFKRRQRMQGKSQYERLNDARHFFTITEHDLKFWINVDDYLDSGLFLDHRPLRQQVSQICQQMKCHDDRGQQKKLLNLFCYTGSFSVYAAAAGVAVTSVDLSKTYLDWARRNFHLNDLKPNDHDFVHDDVLRFLKTDRKYYDLIVLDPPTFSNSKRSDHDFDVERDHPQLIDLCMARLAPKGKLFFSTNKRRFRMDAQLSEKYGLEDITPQTLPRDFRNRLHVCFVLSHAAHTSQ